MGARYVWNRYTAVLQEGIRRRYSESHSDVTGFYFNMTNGQTYQIGSSYNFSTSSGKYTLRNTKNYTYQSKSAKTRGPGYMLSTSGAMYYGENWTEIRNYANQLWPSNDSKDAIKYTALSYEETYEYYVHGSYIDQRSNASSGYYPYDDEDGGYYYVRQGSDEVDPTAVTVPDDIDDGTTIIISLTPNPGKTYGGTISYTYQYRYNGGSWQTLTTTTAVTASLAVPKDQYKTLEVRVRAQDDMGFTSNTWVTSGVKTIIANQPPAAPGIRAGYHCGQRLYRQRAGSHPDRRHRPRRHGRKLRPAAPH